MIGAGLCHLRTILTPLASPLSFQPSIMVNRKRTYSDSDLEFYDLAQRSSAFTSALNSKTFTRLSLNGHPSSRIYVVIPPPIETIQYASFDGEIGLRSIKFPGSLKEIMHHAFLHCQSLGPSLELPPSIQKIGGQCFKGCSSLTHVAIPPLILLVEDGVFEFCFSLSSIVLSSAAPGFFLGARSFGDCDALSSISIRCRTPSFHPTAFEGCLNLNSLATAWGYGNDVPAFVGGGWKKQFYLFAGGALSAANDKFSAVGSTNPLANLNLDVVGYIGSFLTFPKLDEEDE
jgi:hypothetical protein